LSALAKSLTLQPAAPACYQQRSSTGQHDEERVQMAGQENLLLWIRMTSTKVSTGACFPRCILVRRTPAAVH